MTNSSSQEKVSIAVVILTYNEELHLDRALDHVVGFAHEIFVIDSFSTDQTVSQAQARGANVLQHRFQNQAKQFQWAMENAPISSDWVMRLDADEIVEADLAAEIVSKLPMLPPEITGINLNRKTIFQGQFIRHGGRYPLSLLRIWRRGMAQIEDRWMDEHVYLLDGKSVTFRGGFADHNLMDLTAFTDKHNRYASREALDVIRGRLQVVETPQGMTSRATSRQAKAKRLLKEAVYNHIPYQFSAAGYFLLRYIFQLGFLDGRQGLVYHVLQGFWYRFLVGAKVRELEVAIREAGNSRAIEGEIARLTRLELK